MHIDPKENMNPAEEIKELKEKRGALESQLLVVGISEVERIAIHQRIIAIDQQIVALTQQSNVLTQKHMNDSAYERNKSVYPYLIGGAVVIYYYPTYMVWRHNTCGWPYTVQQLRARRWFYHSTLPALLPHLVENIPLPKIPIFAFKRPLPSDTVAMGLFIAGVTLAFQPSVTMALEKWYWSWPFGKKQ